MADCRWPFQMNNPFQDWGYNEAPACWGWSPLFLGDQGGGGSSRFAEGGGGGYPSGLKRGDHPPTRTCGLAKKTTPTELHKNQCPRACSRGGVAPSRAKEEGVGGAPLLTKVGEGVGPLRAQRGDHPPFGMNPDKEVSDGVLREPVLASIRIVGG